MNVDFLRHQVGNIDKGFFHTAFLFRGAGVFPDLEQYIAEEMGISFEGNSDILKKEVDGFGVDDARAIRERVTRSAFASDGKKLIFLRANFFTREAQNALLKVLEEPGEHTHFFVATPFVDALLPTLRSRMLLVETPLSSREGVSGDDDAHAFLRATFAGQSKQIKKLADAKDRAGALLLLRSMEDIFIQEGFTDTNVRLLGELQKMQSYLQDTSSSVKMVLEHVALLVVSKRSDT